MRDRASADAPGRVNLIGEHTDYHGGFVLPTIIPQRTRVHIERRDDCRIRARSAAFGGNWQEYNAGGEARGRGWLDYVQGVTATLAGEGIAVPGFDVHIESTIPVGAGVSSSAALEVSLMRALRTLLNLTMDNLTLARLAQRVETEFVGAPVGIMDQVAASLGRDREALFLDTRNLAVQRLPVPTTLEIIVIDSRIPHEHASGEYAVRRRESFEAAKLLGVERLRDLDVTALPRIERLPPILARRARHIVTENQRVLDAVAALHANDPMRLGALFAASHASMRDDYEVSTPEIDVLVDIGRQHPDVYGARMTGGGFGGAAVMLAASGRGRPAAEAICADYRRHTHRDGVVLVPLGSTTDPDSD